MNNGKLKSVIYGALLHDIGKLIQRAESNKSQNHSCIGYQYMVSYRDSLKFDDEVLDSIKYHHAYQLKDSDLRDDNVAYIIYEADNIASGVDRRKDNESESSENKYISDLPLHSVFNKIGENTNFAYYLRDFDEKNCINYPKIENIKATQDKYSQIKRVLDENISSIKSYNSLLQLLESITSFIPSSTNASEIADISLYDHLKLTCAIASCMYSYFEEHEVENYKEKCFSTSSIENNRNTNYYRLVSLDLSGVQDFIYTIASKNALKSMRARSFYLDFLMEYCCNQVIKELKLSRANILYQGAGHSYLLLPNTSNAMQVLSNIVEFTNDWFLEHFSIDLYLSYATAECNSLDLMQNCADIFKTVSKELSKNKLSRYSPEQLEDIFDSDYSRIKVQEEGRECNICKSSSKKISDDGICDLCLSFIELGKYLCGKDNLAICVSSKQDTYSVELPSYDTEKSYFNVKILTDNNLNQLVEDSTQVYTINHWYSGDDKYSTNIWLGNYAPDKSIDFSMLAQKANGIDRVAIMRADVDNLGSTFVSGIPKGYNSISRHATLSRQLSMFFKYYINQLCDGLNVVIVYSGGDDVFVVGAWNEVLDFAEILHKSFSEYTCGKLTFSCGIGFFKPSFPVYKMAELTGKLEDLAKANPTKNSIALFGEGTNIKNDTLKRINYTFTWEDFYKICNYTEEIKDFCYFNEEDQNNSKLYFSTSLMYKILNLISKYENINIARFAYTLARIEPKNTKDNESLMQNYKKIKKLLWDLYNENKKMLETILYLIIYENRKDKSDGDK